MCASTFRDSDLLGQITAFHRTWTLLLGFLWESCIGSLTRVKEEGKEKGGAVLQLYRDRLQRENKLGTGDDKTSQKRRRS